MAADGPPAKRARPECAGGIVLYTGDEGSLTHIAATEFCKGARNFELRSSRSFRTAFEEVAKAEALYAVVPIEQSSSGSVRSTYDLLVEHEEIVIAGELGVREVYCLCAKRGVAHADIKRVLSHPNILEACSTYLGERLQKGPETIATRSTTEAVEMVASSAEASGAAIATREAACRRGLTILAEGIGNSSYEETRYVLIRRRHDDDSSEADPFPQHLHSETKRSALFGLRNEPGAIFKLLSVLALRDVNVLKAETRTLSANKEYPWLSTPKPLLWDYLFYIDYAVRPTNTTAQNLRVWEALCEFSLWQRDFGVYPSHVSNVEKTPASWADMVDLMHLG